MPVLVGRTVVLPTGTVRAHSSIPASIRIVVSTVREYMLCVSRALQSLVPKVDVRLRDRVSSPRSQERRNRNICTPLLARDDYVLFYVEAVEDNVQIFAAASGYLLLSLSCMLHV